MSNTSFVIPEFAYPHLHFCAKIIYFHDRPLSQIRLKACGAGIHFKISSFKYFLENNLSWLPYGCWFD